MEVNVIIRLEDDNTCSRNCPFVSHYGCSLFNEELEDTILKEGLVWQDSVEPTKQRCYRCGLIDQ